MPTHDKTKVWIEVDGQPVEEFRASTSNLNQLHRRVECTIASQADKNFSIHILDESSWLSTDVRCKAAVYLDGVLCRRLMSPLGVIAIREARVDNSTCRLLKFAAIQFADLDGAAPIEESYRELGSVRVEISYARAGTMHRSSSQSDYWQSNSAAAKLDQGPLSEKSKKAGGNRSVLGDRVTTEYLEVMSTQLTHLPVTTFVFTHAPRSWLQAQEIIPRDAPVAAPPEENEVLDVTPAPSKKRKRSEARTTVKDEDDVQFLTNEEAGLYRQLQLKMKNERKKVKSEVKREPSQISLPKNGQKTVIDLTLD